MPIARSNLPPSQSAGNVCWEVSNGQSSAPYLLYFRPELEKRAKNIADEVNSIQVIPSSSVRYAQAGNFAPGQNPQLIGELVKKSGLDMMVIFGSE